MEEIAAINDELAPTVSAPVESTHTKHANL